MYEQIERLLSLVISFILSRLVALFVLFCFVFVCDSRAFEIYEEEFLL